MRLFGGLLVAIALLAAPTALADVNVATCDRAIIGSGKADWRSESLVAGPVGVLRHPLRQMSRTAGGLVAKMPLLVDGHTPVTVAVPKRLQSRIHLYYGRILDSQGHPNSSFSGSAGFSEIRFEPCETKPRTIWPGGIRIKGTAPVHLLVLAEGSEPVPLRLGRPKLYNPERAG